MTTGEYLEFLVVERGYTAEEIIPTINWIVNIYIDKVEERFPLEALRKYIIKAMVKGYRAGDDVAYEFYKSYLIQSGSKLLPRSYRLAFISLHA